MTWTVSQVTVGSQSIKDQRVRIRLMYPVACWHGRQPSTVQGMVDDVETSLRANTGESFIPATKSAIEVVTSMV